MLRGLDCAVASALSVRAAASITFARCSGVAASISCARLSRSLSPAIQATPQLMSVAAVATAATIASGITGSAPRLRGIDSSGKRPPAAFTAAAPALIVSAVSLSVRYLSPNSLRLSKISASLSSVSAPDCTAEIAAW